MGRLCLKPPGEMEFVLANGTVVKRAVSEALIELPGYGERRSPAALGEDENFRRSDSGGLRARRRSLKKAEAY
ncbi:hypothetical protein [Pyrobaculum aerophilum]|nr:hypothetical protein [Pyrobaculum aerophilum]